MADTQAEEKRRQTAKEDLDEERPIGARLALGLPYAAGIDHIDYVLTFTFLDQEPPYAYNTEHYTSVRQNGELVAILPCWTRADGEGLNQVDVRAEIAITGREQPIIGTASTLFTCVRNADTTVNLLLNVVTGLDAGFLDIDLAPTGTLCASKVDLKDDGYLGVCPDSTCGAADAVFVFANTCLTARGTLPTFWVCGDPTDWVVQSTLAESLFPIPETDGSWTFGVYAVDPLRMSQVDLTLTDEDKLLKVWAGVSAAFAELTRQGSAITHEDIVRKQLAFAAALAGTPLNPGEPAPTLLLTVENGDLGANVAQLERFGACNRAVEGSSRFLNYDVVDVRLDGPGRAVLFLRAKGSDWISAKTLCTTGWSEASQPIITCDHQTPVPGP